MNLEQLEYIVEVAKTKSISTASNYFDVTLSAISQSISSLESELDLKLFTRSRKGTIPTPAGERIIKKAIEAIQIIQEIKDESNYQTQNYSGKLRVAAIPGAMPTLVKTIVSFKKEYPNVEFEVSENGSMASFNDIRSNKIDIGLLSLSRPILEEKVTGIVFEPFSEEKFVIVVGKNSPLASRNKVTPDDLSAYSFVLYNDEPVHEFIRLLTERIGAVRVLFTSNNKDAILSAVTEGLAITVGQAFSVIKSDLVDNGTVVKIDIAQFKQPPLSIGWVRSENNPLSKLTNIFIERFKYEYNKEAFL